MLKIKGSSGHLTLVPCCWWEQRAGGCLNASHMSSYHHNVSNRWKTVEEKAPDSIGARDRDNEVDLFNWITSATGAPQWLLIDWLSWAQSEDGLEPPHCTAQPPPIQWKALSKHESKLQVLSFLKHSLLFNSVTALSNNTDINTSNVPVRGYRTERRR